MQKHTILNKLCSFELSIQQTISHPH